MDETDNTTINEMRRDLTNRIRDLEYAEGDLAATEGELHDVERSILKRIVRVLDLIEGVQR